MTDWLALDLDEIAEWPLLPKIVVILLLCLVVKSAGYWFFLQPLIDDIEQMKAEELSLRSTVEYKYKQIAVVPQIDRQLSELNLRYYFLARQLPAQKELASVLSSINQSGINHQLSFTRIDWGEREEQPFFYKLPLNIEATGKYHDIGAFSEAIADLPRMISLDVVDIQRITLESDMLHFRVMANTYQLKSAYE
ncbi:type 4a pilus biogenesis protein PilO [Aliivibrio sp. S3MY1]|uniref:type 4a pilus biogenesis protein PilO n=1 Tax=unclassified Aliivibrio TaxID=2645654 RepID=UPI002377F0EC|nr:MULTISPECIES: type 4a pilus biogenesis protein PilO [unclassified Aliivibrio]MDD9195173.1 type 4a pilus biogenesis protein PilO [Aliivibrio sp. S3MY1]MDD9197737.1 type 4a pilus biogenesis protein PilO [Aliivibrio sp. S2MY1]